ncbi:hypothetical protein LX32DRAFT_195883 [Colletotrichum zoysiae]|uniref:Uncharacterized protein n=1 Tax=Colletotrichum zoysiae TaxID=1216348 RepID=A0AAD9HNY6_9PEZI|nr:hypothetical protein LX32DRAFT_195883 [Colletotrichum zoysiae]
MSELVFRKETCYIRAGRECSAWKARRRSMPGTHASFALPWSLILERAMRFVVNWRRFLLLLFSSFPFVDVGHPSMPRRYTGAMWHMPSNQSRTVDGSKRATARLIVSCTNRCRGRNLQAPAKEFRRKRCDDNPAEWEGGRQAASGF